MIHENKNYCRSRVEDITVSNGDTFIRCNFSQSIPHTEILSGLTGLSFQNCNLVNCDVPEGATIEGGLHIHKSMCSHLHQNRVSEIGECDEECEHISDTDTITIDGSTITVYHYQDKVVE